MPGYGEGAYGEGEYGFGLSAPVGVPGRISWSSMADRTYETGLDRGVLYLNDGTVVPWNGLTAVDESGADSATAYYIDGRPFLHLPKPKEFTATIKAYTYPDEFASVMGLVEVTDGMYLDSQMGGSFHLCYRTLIGSALKGEAEGYKIHLVYNATVNTPGRSYGTLTNTISPIDLEWDIQAVPMPVEGYRPTAHIIIDTRHMDAVKLAEIEDILYGTDVLAPTMPDPQTVFDTMSYGDTLIVIDNGDGTWEARGSNAVLSMVEDGVFQVNHALAIDNGDGTFELSSSP